MGHDEADPSPACGSRLRNTILLRLEHQEVPSPRSLIVAGDRSRRPERQCNQNFSKLTLIKRDAYDALSS